MTNTCEHCGSSGKHAPYCVAIGGHVSAVKSRHQMTNTEAKVRRYEGYLRTRGGWEDEQRQWYVPAADHDAAIASLRDQLQASQVAEQMASDDVRELKREVEELREKFVKYGNEWSNALAIEKRRNALLEELLQNKSAISGKAP